MITDIFARRYSEVVIRGQYFEEDRRFMMQAAVMIMDPLWLGQPTSEQPSNTTEESLKRVHDSLALELGQDYLSDSYLYGRKVTYATICKNFLIKIPADLAKGDVWIKERLSLVELAFGLRLSQIQDANRDLPQQIAKAQLQDAMRGGSQVLRVPGNRADGIRALNARINTTFDELVKELNERMRLASYGLNFHNGVIQVVNDQTINEQVAKPFWALVADPTWTNVDEQMKEALDRRDRGDRTAAFHAVCALESTIRIVSDLKGWTRGNEKGAANYVDNLVSHKNGRFIEVWEGEMLKAMFSDVRNPFAHGPGQAAMPKLLPEQSDWAIDTAMSWIKSLIRRM